MSRFQLNETSLEELCELKPRYDDSTRDLLHSASAESHNLPENIPKFMAEYHQELADLDNECNDLQPQLGF